MPSVTAVFPAADEGGWPREPNGLRGGGGGHRPVRVESCLFRRPGLPPPCPPPPLGAFPEGCFSRDLLSKWRLDSGLEASWGRIPHPTPV